MQLGGHLENFDSTPLLIEAKALGDSTRFRIFNLIASSTDEVDVASITKTFKLNHNAIRQHLNSLKHAALITERVEERQTRGRPRLLYRLNPEVRGKWTTSGPYLEIAKLLAETLKRKKSTYEIGKEEGKHFAREIHKSSKPQNIIDTLVRDMELRGFRPLKIQNDSKTILKLNRCPFEDVAKIDPDSICDLHRGLIEGMLEGLDSQAKIALIPKFPEFSGCKVELEL